MERSNQPPKPECCLQRGQEPESRGMPAPNDLREAYTADSPPARIAELPVRSGVSIYRRTPLRFHLESRWPSVDISATNTMLSPRAIPLRKRLGEYTNSEHDWAWILHALAHVNGVVEW